MHAISIRLLLLVVGIAFGDDAAAQSLPGSSAREPARVVFVCEHGSVKSLVASVYFNRRAAERGLPFRAVARGIAPERGVPRPVREGLRGDGFEVATFKPRLFKPSDLDGAALVVSFDQDITKAVSGRTRHLKWDGLPEVLPNYSQGREVIVTHVNTLIDELARGASP